MLNCFQVLLFKFNLHHYNKDTTACYLNQSVYNNEMAFNARNQEIVDDLVRRKLMDADPTESLSAYTMVGRCRLPVSKSVFNAPRYQRLNL